MFFWIFDFAYFELVERLHLLFVVLLMVLSIWLTDDHDLRPEFCL